MKSTIISANFPIDLIWTKTEWQSDSQCVFNNCWMYCTAMVNWPNSQQRLITRNWWNYAHLLLLLDARKCWSAWNQFSMKFAQPSGAYAIFFSHYSYVLSLSPSLPWQSHARTCQLASWYTASLCVYIFSLIVSHSFMTMKVGDRLPQQPIWISFSRTITDVTTTTTATMKATSIFRLKKCTDYRCDTEIYIANSCARNNSIASALCFRYVFPHFFHRILLISPTANRNLEIFFPFVTIKMQICISFNSQVHQREWKLTSQIIQSLLFPSVVAGLPCVAYFPYFRLSYNRNRAVQCPLLSTVLDWFQREWHDTDVNVVWHWQRQTTVTFHHKQLKMVSVSVQKREKKHLKVQ